MFAHTYAVTTLNPKSLVFFLAFVSQVVDPARQFLPQAAAAIGTFVTMAALTALGVALLAAAGRQRLRQPRVQRVVSWTGGSLLIGAGALAFDWRRTT